MADDRSVFECIETATMLKPGDRVLITTSAKWSHEQVQRADGVMAARFPGVEFTFLTESALTILPGTADG